MIKTESGKSPRPARTCRVWSLLNFKTIFLEEGLGFEFRDGQVQRRGRRHTVDRVSQAEVVLGDPRLDSARKHYAKSLQFFRDPVKADYQNAVKEAVCAVEAARKALLPDAKAATLGDLTKWLITGEVQMPKSLAQTFSGCTDSAVVAKPSPPYSRGVDRVSRTGSTGSGGSDVRRRAAVLRSGCFDVTPC